MIIASSPFLYIPKYSGIAFLHVWNYIQQDVFIRRFTDIIKEKYDNFFVDCIIEPITDLRTFYKKISQLKSIERIKATIRPPNPLFGYFWESLKEYIIDRNASEMKLDEKSAPGNNINNDLKKIIDIIITEGDVKEIEKTSIKIGDASILMAADGYGHGQVEGIEGKKTVIVSTKQTKLSIKFDKDPDPIKLKEEVTDIFKEIKKQRHMDH